MKMKMRRLCLLCGLIALGVLAAVAREYRPEDVPNVHVGNRTQYVSNPDGILSQEAVDTLNAMLGNIWATTTAEPVVVVIDKMADDYDIDHFANDLFELWGIGKKDTENGLLILVSADDRRYVARTGRGLGGVLPDVVCGRILRNEAAPRFREGDYDGGVIAAARLMGEAITNPTAAEEIRSKYSNDADAGEDEDLFSFILWCGAIAGAGSLVWVIWIIVASRGKSDQERYRQLNTAKPVVMFLSFMGLGLPVPALLLCLWKMKRLRDHGRRCPNCDNPMHKLDEATDNNYLTPAQDLEERLNSVDYDVWLCDRCGEKDVIPYVNRQSAYTECKVCGARTCAMSGNRIIAQPTTRSEGRGERIYECRNCNHKYGVPYRIAKLAAPVVILPGGGGGGGFGGGGFGGGSFGGGGTSGGGASGGW